MKTNHIRPIVVMSMLVLLALACEIPMASAPAVNSPTQVPVEAIYTSAAQTLAAQLTQNAPPVIPPTATLPAEQPAVVDTVAVPTVTFTPILFTATETPSPTPPFTPTPLMPTITAQQNTNCRKGPGPAYERVGALMIGQTSIVYGRNSSSTWWYIENPERKGTYCWVWGGSTTVSGAASSLPVFTPPPPPATATKSGTGSETKLFSISYAARKKCSGDWYAYFSVKNTGEKVLESAAVKIRDFTTDTILSSTASDNPFLGATNDCPPGSDSLDVGDSAYVAGKMGSVPSGHEIKANITICTKEGLTGSCESYTIRFTAP